MSVKTITGYGINVSFHNDNIVVIGATSGKYDYISFDEPEYSPMSKSFSFETEYGRKVRIFERYLKYIEWIPLFDEDESHVEN